MRMEEILHHRLPRRQERRIVAALTLTAAVLVLPMAPAVVAGPSGTPAADAEITDQDRSALTVHDLRTINNAVVAWSRAEIAKGNTAAGKPKAHLVEGLLPTAHYTPIDADALSRLLVPTYLDELPTHDGWGHPYDFRVNLTTPASKQLVLVRSAGRDGVFEGEAYAVEGFPLDSFNRDIVHADGYFAAWPDRSRASTDKPES